MEICERTCSLSSLNWRAITNGELYGFFSSSGMFSTSFFYFFFRRYRVLQTPPCSTLYNTLILCISFWESVCRNVQFTKKSRRARFITFAFCCLTKSWKIGLNGWRISCVCASACAGAYGMYRLKFYCWKYDNKIGTCKERQRQVVRRF